MSRVQFQWHHLQQPSVEVQCYHSTVWVHQTQLPALSGTTNTILGGHGREGKGRGCRYEVIDSLRLHASELPPSTYLSPYTSPPYSHTHSPSPPPPLLVTHLDLVIYIAEKHDCHVNM